MKNVLVKKILSAALVLALTIPLAGCAIIGGGKEGGSGSGNGGGIFSGGGKDNNKVSSEDAKKGVFTYNEFSLGNKPAGSNGGYINVDAIASDGTNGYVVSTATSYDDSGNSVNTSTLTAVDTNGNVLSTNTMEFPDFSSYKTVQDGITVTEQYEGTNLQNVREVGGNFVGLVNFNFYYYDEDWNYYDGGAVMLCSWDKSAKLLWSCDLKQNLKASYCNVNSLFAVGDQIYAYVEAYTANDENISGILTLDQNGNILKNTKVDPSSNLSNVIVDKNGRAIAFHYDDQWNTVASYYDINTLTYGETAAIPDSVLANGYYSIKPGFDTDFMFTNSNGICKFNVGDTDVSLVMSPINSDLQSYGIDNYAFIDETHFIASYSNIENYETCAAVFTYVDPKDIPDKETLSLAVYYLDGDVRSRVIDFNKTNDKYRIVVKDYSIYQTNDDWTAGFTQFNNDVLAGNVCDIIMMRPDQGADLDMLAKKKLLVDLDKLIAEDEELKNYSYLTNVFDAYAIQGKHYLGVPSVNYQSYMGSSDIFGNVDHVSISDFVNIVKSQGAGTQFSDYIDRDSFMSIALNYDGAEFIDPASQKCDFDSEDFATLLEYANTIPEEYVYDESTYYEDYNDQFRSGKTLLYSVYINNLRDVNYFKYSMFNGKGILVGFPTRNDQGGMFYTDDVPFAITNGKHQDGAWEFVRYYLTPDFQDNLSYSIPVLESSFNDWAAKGMEKDYWEDENGIKQYYEQTYYIDGIEHEVPTLTAEEVEELKNIIKSCKKASYTNEQVKSIIEEEASAYFAGSKTAKDVCSIIQSRVQLYLNENN